MSYTMKGSPAKLGTIQGTAAHASALKKKSLMEKLIPSASTRDKIKKIYILKHLKKFMIM